MKKIQNTKQLGIARIFIYPEKNKYIAVCLDFDIIEEAGTRKEVEELIMEAVCGYIENIVENNLSNKLLNRNAPDKYWNKYREYLKLISAKDEKKVKVSQKIQNSSFTSFPVGEFITKEKCFA